MPIGSDLNAARTLVVATTKGAPMIWINLAALNYALEYDADSKDQRIVLFELAYHSDDGEYTWPSTKGIATRWRMNRETVREQIKALLARRAIFRTKKRRGDTRQIKVYRMPKFIWESGSQTTPSSGGEEAAKGRRRGRQTATNKEQGTRDKNNSEEKAKSNSLPSLGNGPLAGPLGSVLSSLSSRIAERQEPTWFYEIRRMYLGTTIDNDLKQIEEWARKNRKEFTRDLALNALRRNPPKKLGQRDGYV